MVIAQTYLVYAGHLLDLDILSRVLESAGGPCDQLRDQQQGKNMEAMRTGYTQLTNMINNVTNLAYIDDQLEEMVTLKAN